MRTLGTGSTNVFIGSFPEELTEADLKNKLASSLPEADGIGIGDHQQPVPADLRLPFVCHSKFGIQVESLLALHGLYLSGSTLKRPPQSAPQRNSGRELPKRKQNSARAEAEIAELKDSQEALLYTADYYAMRADKGTGYWANYGKVPIRFVVTGYVPEPDSLALQRELEERYQAFVELETPETDEDVPVKLKNNRFSAPVEPVVEGYSLPAKHEVDPSSVMAIFLLCAFRHDAFRRGLRFPNLLICGVVLLKFRNIEESLRKSPHHVHVLRYFHYVFGV